MDTVPDGLRLHRHTVMCTEANAVDGCGWCLSLGRALLGDVNGPNYTATCPISTNGTWTIDSSSDCLCLVETFCSTALLDTSCGWCRWAAYQLPYVHADEALFQPSIDRVMLPFLQFSVFMTRILHTYMNLTSSVERKILLTPYLLRSNCAASWYATKVALHIRKLSALAAVHLSPRRICMPIVGARGIVPVSPSASDQLSSSHVPCGLFDPWGRRRRLSAVVTGSQSRHSVAAVLPWV